MGLSCSLINMDILLHKSYCNIYRLQMLLSSMYLLHMLILVNEIPRNILFVAK